MSSSPKVAADQLARPRPKFVHMHSEGMDDSAPSSPMPTPAPREENPFAGGSILSFSADASRGNTPTPPPRSPHIHAHIPRVHSTGSGFSGLPINYGLGGDIGSRASGILSPGASSSDLSHVRGPSSTASSGTPGILLRPHHGTDSGIQEVERPGHPRRGHSSVAREAFASPPLRPLTVYSGSRPTTAGGSPSGAAPRPVTKRAKSTMLTGEIEKPWLREKNSVGRIAYLLTYGVAFLGIVASAVRCYFGYRSVPRFKHPLCPVLEDNFDTLDLDTWQHDVDLSGFGNNEFEMTTNSANNSFVKDGMLYIMPTLTSDVIGRAAIFDGYTYNLTDCTGGNYTSCGVVSNQTTNTVINPVMSARLTTKKSHSIRFGRVEIRAKLPRGDWLWPALWMLPRDNVYGEWPMSGEIDIMESRGNAPSYPKQGRNYVRGSLNWGPITWLNAVYKTYGWWTERRTSYDKDFHTYVLEWTEEWMRVYVDTRLHHMLDLRFNQPFFERGNFPAVVTNGTDQVVLKNPWAANATVVNAAPFDQNFYLVMNVAVGGTNGWFPDNAGDKPWLDGSLTAMRDFALRQDEWYSTWPQGNDIDDRAMIVDYVKMWKEC